MSYPISPGLEKPLLALQAFQVLVLWTHDVVPLGRLNDLPALHRVYSTRRIFWTTVLQSIPWTIGLALSLRSLGRPYSGGLVMWLDYSYVALFLGELRAWWVPYLFYNDEPRAARYRAMFSQTHAFLPERNGIRPNTLHIALHVATAATLLVLYLAGFFD